VIDGDERLASASAAVADDSATSWRGGKDIWIARGKERNAGTDDEGYLRVKLEWAAEEGVAGFIHTQQDGAAFAAFVDCLLNSRGVELLFVGGPESIADCLQLCVNRGAELRKERFDDSAGVLCVQTECEAKRKDETDEPANHSDSPWT